MSASTPTKQELLLAYLRRRAPMQRAEKIRRRTGDVPVPLSLVQEPIFIRSQQRGLPLLYNESITIHRSGQIDVSVLETTLSEIVRRHEIWRTTFERVDGQIVQIVHEPRPVVVRTHDIRHVLPATARVEESLRLGEQDSKQPFDLSQGPLVRFRLVRMADEEFRLFVTMHQIVCDGITVFRLLMAELSQLYEAFSNNQPSALPELTVQYSDFALWQRRTLGSELDRQLGFWQRQLTGDISPLPWPKSRQRPVYESFRGAIEPFALSGELSNSIRNFASRNGVTLFTALVTALAAVLHNYTGETEIPLGTVSPCGRKRSEVQELFGYFLNPVCLRLKVSGNITVSEMLQHCYASLSEAMSHDDVPLETLAAAFSRPDPSRHPFFTVATSLEPPLATSSGWSLTPMDLQTGGARWDLYIVFDDRPDGIIGRLQYNPDLLDSIDLSQLVDDLAAALGTMTAGADQSLSRLRADARRSSSSIAA